MRLIAVTRAIRHRNIMENEPDQFEQSARIVEAFAAGRDGDVAELLAEIAKAIRDHATDD